MTIFAFLGDAPRVVSATRHFAWGYIPFILLLTTFNYFLRGVKWNYYLKLMGIPISRSEGNAIFACGLSMAMTPGKVGELIKSWLLRERAGIPMAVSLPIIFAERLTDGVAMLFLASGGLLLFRQGWQALTLIALAAIAIVAVVQSRSLSERILLRLSRVKALHEKALHLQQLYESAFVLLRPKPLVTALCIGIVSWSGECIAFLLVLVGLGFVPSVGLMIRAAFTLASSTLIGSVSLLPGGLGTAEASSSALLLAIVPHMTKTDAIVATLLIRFCTLWFGVAVGLVSVALFGKKLGLTAQPPQRAS